MIPIEDYFHKNVNLENYLREHGTHKGRVSEANNCEYCEGTYMTADIRQFLDEYNCVMSTLVTK